MARLLLDIIYGLEEDKDREKDMLKEIEKAISEREGAAYERGARDVLDRLKPLIGDVQVPIGLMRPNPDGGRIATPNRKGKSLRERVSRGLKPKKAL